MRLVTYNLWHGLDGRGQLFFGHLESRGRTELRHQMLRECLCSLGGDILCLQEVSPLRRRVSELKKALGLRVRYHWDSAGLKLGHWGPPFNLSSGLATFVNPALSPLSHWYRQLSGPGATFLRHPLALQFKEARQALFVEAFHPQGRVLTVNTHLHNGLEYREELVQSFREAFKDEPQYQKQLESLLLKLRKGHVRRLREVSQILDEIEKRQSRYGLIVVMGDFNASPGDATYGLMKESGFRDVWEIHGGSGGQTWDPVHNAANYRLQANFSWPLWQEAQALPSRLREAVEQIILREEERRRRIDYIWVRTQRGALQIKDSQLFGLPEKSGMAPSDHFGLWADVSWSG